MTTAQESTTTDLSTLAAQMGLSVEDMASAVDDALVLQTTVATYRYAQMRRCYELFTSGTSFFAAEKAA